MKHRIITIAATVISIGLPASVHAAEHAASPPAVMAEKPAGQPSMGGMNCPMMGDMQKNMGSMMGNMNSMMQMMSDPVMRERMQKMHEEMGAMMQMMTDMHKRTGGIMWDEKTKAKDAPTAPVASDPHHPDKQ